MGRLCTAWEEAAQVDDASVRSVIVRSGEGRAGETGLGGGGRLGMVGDTVTGHGAWLLGELPKSEMFIIFTGQ